MRPEVCNEVKNPPSMYRSKEESVKVESFLLDHSIVEAQVPPKPKGNLTLARNVDVLSEVIIVGVYLK